jgi:hypothetical protein
MRKVVMRMLWVAVWYRGIALPDIMKMMRLWLDQRRFEPTTFDYVISRFGTLVRVQFPCDGEAVEFAEAFGGEISRKRPSIEGTDENSAERSASHGY